MPEPVTQQAEVQQPPMPQPQMQADIQDVELPRDAKWTVFLEPSLGTRIDLPSAVLSMPDGPAYRGVGRQFRSADGRAAVAIYSQRNNQRDTPARYLRRNFLFPRAAVTYERVTRDFFAVSGVREDKIFYSRCNVSHTGGTLHCFDLQFPARERAAWDAIVDPHEPIAAAARSQLIAAQTRDNLVRWSCTASAPVMSSATACATRMPSTAADRMPPA